MTGGGRIKVSDSTRGGNAEGSRLVRMPSGVTAGAIPQDLNDAVYSNPCAGI